MKLRCFYDLQDKSGSNLIIGNFFAHFQLIAEIAVSKLQL